MAGRLYIAGPITGRINKNLIAFEQAEEGLIAAHYTVYNPRRLESISPVGASYSWFMRNALQMVLMADGVALLDEWEQSPGARIEHFVALTCEIPCRPVAEWIAMTYQETQ